MATILPFETGCASCIYLDKVEKQTYWCGAIVQMDDSPIVPIQDGAKTIDWYICSGQYYVRKKHHK